MPVEDLNRLSALLSESIEFAKTVSEIERDKEAKTLWYENYAKLTAERSGAFGNATARARAQVVRLSLIYALMDKSNIVRKNHLEAALDFWKYCEYSAKQIFGESTGDKLADDIYRLIKTSRTGLSRTEIIKKTGNNYPVLKLQASLQILLENGLVFSRNEKRKGSPKPVEVWYCYEFNELTDSSKEETGLENLEMPLNK